MKIICGKCDCLTKYKKENVRWDENGFGYSTKLLLCEHCGALNVIEHVDDINIDINLDNRFYEYNK